MRMENGEGFFQLLFANRNSTAQLEEKNFGFWIFNVARQSIYSRERKRETRVGLDGNFDGTAKREKEGRTNIAAAAAAAKNAQLFLSRGYVPRKILQRAFVRMKLNVPCTRRYRELDDATPRGKSLARCYF